MRKHNDRMPMHPHHHHPFDPQSFETRERGGRPGPDWGHGHGFAGNPWAPDFVFGGRRGGGPRARRGDVRAAILSLLAEEPRSGYALIQGILERTEGAWKPSPGSVYPTLQQLVDEDLIAATGETGRRSEYRLTETGTAYVAEHADELAKAWDIPQSGPWGDREGLREYRESIGKLMRVVGQFAADATPEQRKAAIAKMDDLRRALYAMLAE